MKTKFPVSKYLIEERPDGLTFLTFPFEICLSFLSPKYNHPITLPALFNTLLTQKRADQIENVKVVVDSYLEFNGTLREGYTKGNQYFQITSAVSPEIIEDFVCHQVITVVVEIQPQSVVVYLNRKG